MTQIPDLEEIVKGTILLVDDDNTPMKILTTILSPQGYKIITANNGLEALEILKTTSVDLVLSDLNMPVIDGKALCKRIKEEHSGLDIMMLTASTDVKESLELYNLGVIDYIVKPVDMNLLVKKIDEYMLYNNRRKNMNMTQTDNVEKTVMVIGDAQNYLHRNMRLKLAHPDYIFCKDEITALELLEKEKVGTVLITKTLNGKEFWLAEQVKRFSKYIKIVAEATETDDVGKLKKITPYVIAIDTPKIQADARMYEGTNAIEFLRGNTNRIINEFEGMIKAAEKERKQDITDILRNGDSEVYIFEGPRGAVKDSIKNMVAGHILPYVVGIANTSTRKPRPGEKEGIHKKFRTKEYMLAHLNDYIHSVYIDGRKKDQHLFGTEIKDITDARKSGMSVILTAATVEIANSYREAFPDAKTILFLADPEVLYKRKKLRDDIGEPRKTTRAAYEKFLPERYKANHTIYTADTMEGLERKDAINELKLNLSIMVASWIEGQRTSSHKPYKTN